MDTSHHHYCVHLYDRRSMRFFVEVRIAPLVPFHRGNATSCARNAFAFAFAFSVHLQQGTGLGQHFSQSSRKGQIDHAGLVGLPLDSTVVTANIVSTNKDKGNRGSSHLSAQDGPDGISFLPGIVESDNGGCRSDDGKGFDCLFARGRAFPRVHDWNAMQ